MNRITLINKLFWTLIALFFCTVSIAQETSKVSTSSPGLIAPARRDVPGSRYALSTGQLFIPGYFNPSSRGEVTLVFFFHGAAWCAEQNFYDARKNAVLVSLSAKDYNTLYPDTAALNRMVDEIRLTLETTRTVTHPQINNIYLSSFSGGYPAIRSILTNSPEDSRIKGILLADSLYAGYEGTTRSMETLRKDQMQPFLNFCREACQGKKEFWFTQLYPPEPKYRDNTTTYTADYLILHSGMKKAPRHHQNKLGMVMGYSAEKRNAHILGYYGMTMQDHMNHFYNIAEYYRLLKIPTARP